jgi:hypothetical protein
MKINPVYAVMFGTLSLVAAGEGVINLGEFYSIRNNFRQQLYQQEEHLDRDKIQTIEKRIIGGGENAINGLVCLGLAGISGFTAGVCLLHKEEK